ncbi:MAG: winged helix-turn-helix domain-containing protein [Candidatus Woesearchaeota archaeon]
MTSFKLAAIKILRNEKKPLHYEEITNKAIEKNLVETTGETPSASMNAQISLDIKAKKEQSAFIRVKRGIYSLNPNFSKGEEKVEFKEEKEKILTDEKERVSSQYIGSAGEHLVVGEMLFRGFNASIMSVDDGIDVVASKNTLAYNIQVKTSRLNKTNVYNFDINVNSYKRYKQGNTFYIFVLRGDETLFVILPYSEIKKNIKEKNILRILDNKRYRVVIKIRDNIPYLGKLNNDISYYMNNWNLIE